MTVKLSLGSRGRYVALLFAIALFHFATLLSYLTAILMPHFPADQNEKAAFFYRFAEAHWLLATGALLLIIAAAWHTSRIRILTAGAFIGAAWWSQVPRILFILPLVLAVIPPSRFPARPKTLALAVATFAAALATTLLSVNIAYQVEIRDIIHIFGLAFLV
jgi:hypothetical protein